MYIWRKWGRTYIEEDREVGARITVLGKRHDGQYEKRA